MATNKFTYKTHQEESNYYQECSLEFEEKNKSLQQRMIQHKSMPLITAKSIHWGSLFIIWKPLMDIDYIMRIQKQVLNQFTFFVTA